MKKTALGAVALALTSTTALAGGIERSVIDYGVLFQPGTQLTFSTALVSPKVSGTYDAALGGGSTGNMAENYASYGFSYKNQFTDKLAFALYNNDAYGADALYTQGAYTGLTATWDSNQTAAMLRYQVADRISVYGGVRYVRSSAEILIPDQMIRPSVQSQLTDGVTQLQNAQAALAGLGQGAGDAQYDTVTAQLQATQTRLAQANAAPFGTFTYTADSNVDGQFGYVLGAAYEIPDIALRVGLTWESAITHKFDTNEALAGAGLNATTQTEIEMPQSVALDFQSGVAAGTLVFGQVKWTEWSKWEVRTPGYEAFSGDAVTGIDNDTWTYRLGIGRKFSDSVSGFAQVTYEPSNGAVASRLSPTDGKISFGIGGQVTEGNMKMRGGIEYVKLGDATDASGTKFKGNSAIGMGLSFTVSF
ncbi:outer membrane protein transport protein [Tropicibacter naphthalenivorans]|uniref:Outer membrane protein transport protein (OMPP1/FadL/TodX) n=1 Tax=Tropicibacter naphthalenivorans TaxID=441103 RepID=A0A0P1G6C3_9RHOB|nr:outer membrane protein transport protein [Tropicibacter naphthalenivorans]CUH77287.1 Outer membrane protein transport protein (OMPP1/FadL/TodX) [Tropicibacter naphthalenivorans]SMC59222.1 Long-chain fatty acid transport protein [Tropicibacter naphthalenivorans]